MTSRKLTLVVFASTVIFKSWSRKTLHMPFLIFSTSCGFPLRAANPSLRYKQMFWPYFATELSKHVWTLKDSNIDHSTSWRIISSNSSYNSSSKRCNLCLKEKFLIICRPDLSSLNKRNELKLSCRHRNKALLCNN